MTKCVEDSLSLLPPEVYVLVKSMTLCAVGERLLTLRESQVAMVVEAVLACWLDDELTAVFPTDQDMDVFSSQIRIGFISSHASSVLLISFK